MDLKKRFRGAILGLAIGDALGMPVEGLSEEEIRNKFGKIEDFIPSPDGFKAGEWTDDTEQMLILAKSIFETVYFNPENFAEKLKRAMYSGKLIKAGPTTRKAIYNLQRGIPWNKAGIIADTCGAAMRVAPIGSFYYSIPNLVEKYAYISSIVTHKGSAAIAGAVAISISLSCICRDFTDDEIIEEVVAKTQRYDDLVSDKISGNSASGFTMLSWDAVPAAFYFFRNTDSYEECVIKAVNSGGDTDSIAAMAGAMKGAEMGIQNIPSRWVENVKDSEYLLEVADGLYSLSSSLV
jgi:ADP-ribosylglycohydrolase